MTSRVAQAPSRRRRPALRRARSPLFPFAPRSLGRRRPRPLPPPPCTTRTKVRLFSFFLLAFSSCRPGQGRPWFSGARGRWGGCSGICRGSRRVQAGRDRQRAGQSLTHMLCFPTDMQYDEDDDEITPDLWQEACWIVIR